MRVKFTKDYDHTWPSRAMTHFPAGWEGTVKAEVADAAVPSHAQALDKATPRDKRSEPADTLPGNLPTDLAEPQALTPNVGVDAPGDSQ